MSKQLKGKLRSINTHFWNDNYVMDLDPIEKLLFLYLLTNQNTNMLGVYELHIRKIAFETGIDKDMIEKIFQRFRDANKISYINGYVCLHNFTKNQSYNDSMKINAVNCYNDLPNNIKNQPLMEDLFKHLTPLPQGVHRVTPPTAEYESEYESESEYEDECERKTKKQNKNQKEVFIELDTTTAKKYKVLKQKVEHWQASFKTINVELELMLLSEYLKRNPDKRRTEPNTEFYALKWLKWAENHKQINKNNYSQKEDDNAKFEKIYKSREKLIAKLKS